MSTPTEGSEPDWPDCHKAQCNQVHQTLDSIMDSLGLERRPQAYAVGKAAAIAIEISRLQSKSLANDAARSRKESHRHWALRSLGTGEGERMKPKRKVEFCLQRRRVFDRGWIGVLTFTKLSEGREALVKNTRAYPGIAYRLVKITSIQEVV